MIEDVLPPTGKSSFVHCPKLQSFINPDRLNKDIFFFFSVSLLSLKGLIGRLQCVKQIYFKYILVLNSSVSI